MPGGSPIEVRVSRHFTSPPERVFDAWLDPASARHWLFATPGGEMVRVEMDARPGGAWTVVERRPAGDASHHGRYVTIDRPRLLAFTFGTDPSEPPSPVTVTIAPVDGGGCEATLVHEMPAKWAAYAGKTRDGWQHILDGLARTLGE
jgi:uncharacterized protein YndB with AHSA1/START domain